MSLNLYLYGGSVIAAEALIGQVNNGEHFTAGFMLALLWPAALKQPLLNEVAELIDPSDPVAALGTAGLVIRACASYLAEDDWDGAAAVLKRVADRG